MIILRREGMNEKCSPIAFTEKKIDTWNAIQHEMKLIKYRLALGKDIICMALFRKWKGIKLE